MEMAGSLRAAGHFAFFSQWYYLPVSSTAASRAAAAKASSGEATTRLGCRNRAAKNHRCNAAYEQNRFCIHNKLGF